ncbi:MAG: hypothetical protein AAB438_03280 [Patescibacteria group bacterium]
MSWLTVNVLESTLKSVTRQERLWLPQEGLNLSSVEICMEDELSRITFYQCDVFPAISVFDKELNKSVTLDFNFCGEDSVFVFVNFWKQKRTIAFWKKPSLRIGKTISYKVSKEDENNDENIKFVLDRVPEFLINLR